MENTEEKYTVVQEESECTETQMKEEVNRGKLRRLLKELVRPENFRALYSIIAVQSKDAVALGTLNSMMILNINYL